MQVLDDLYWVALQRLLPKCEASWWLPPERAVSLIWPPPAPWSWASAGFFALVLGLGRIWLQGTRQVCVFIKQVWRHTLRLENTIIQELAPSYLFDSKKVSFRAYLDSLLVYGAYDDVCADWSMFWSRQMLHGKLPMGILLGLPPCNPYNQGKDWFSCHGKGFPWEPALLLTSEFAGGMPWGWQQS